MKKLLACITILLTALSCQKVAVDCIYTVRVNVQERQGGEKIPAEDVKVYAFFVDPAKWTVENIDDARQGVITSLENGEKLRDGELAVKVFDDTEDGSQYLGKNRFEKPFTQQNVMLVASHDQQNIFAFGNAHLQLNLDRMEVSLVFELYRTDTEPYVQGLWEVHNAGTQVPVRCDYTVTSKQKRVESATLAATALNTTRLHVFYLSAEEGNPADWKVSSWEDAAAGVLSNGAARKEPAEVYIEYGANTAKATITQGKAVLVVYDTAQPMYAYAPANLTNNPETQTDEVVFYPYRSETVMDPIDNIRWTVVMEDTGVSTLLNVSPRHKYSAEVFDSNAEPLTTTIGYAFYADSTQWSVLSYEDALAGRITAKEGGETRDADVEGRAVKYGMRVGLELTQEEGHDKVMVVICDTVQPMYALTQVEPGRSNWSEAVPQTVVFSPYRPDETYITGSWEIRNGETTVPIDN